ncbi:MAG: glycosidase, partial [Gammaproteobacteria bacterium]
MQVSVNRKDLKFLPDFSRVIARFLYTGDERALCVIRSVLDMSEKKASIALKQVL